MPLIADYQRDCLVLVYLDPFIRCFFFFLSPYYYIVDLVILYDTISKPPSTITISIRGVQIPIALAKGLLPVWRLQDGERCR